MKISALILGIIGGLAAGALGAKWLSDARSLRGEIELVRAMGVDTGEINRLSMGAYVLLVSLVLGIAGGILAMKGKGKPAAAVMIVAGVAPAIFAPAALLFTSLLLAGGLVSLGVRQRHPVSNM